MIVHKQRRSQEEQLTWLGQIEKICVERGAQITPLRRAILEILARSDGPIGAYALMDELSHVQQRSVAPPTVYRTLEFLVENGFVVKIESRNAFAACDTPGHDHHGVLLICSRCGKSDEVENAGLDSLLREMASSSGFRMQRRVVEIDGLCESCCREA
jgi:Fur family zinc uptake transcriptional regulator